MRKNWPFWLPKLNFFTSTVAKKSLDPKTQPQNTHCKTQQQNTHRDPTATLPYTGFALSPWQHQPLTQLLVLPIPIGPGQVRDVRLALSTTGSLVWGAKERPIKNREMDGALTLGGRGLMKNNNNQLRVGIRGGRDVGEEARVS